MTEPAGEESASAAAGGVPVMPEVRDEVMGRDPYLIAGIGPGHNIGWQDSRKYGRVFVVARAEGAGIMASTSVVARFPLTEAGWAEAFAALADLDPGAAGRVRAALAPRAETADENEMYAAFERSPSTIFRALGVQVLAGADSVYSIGSHDPAARMNTSRVLGPLGGARAVVTDGAQAWSPGRAMFLPIGLAGLATKTRADAAVIFPDGTVHTAALNSNRAIREAQLQAVQFNALAGTAAPQPPVQPDDPTARLRTLRELLDTGLISQAEYDAKRTEIISSI